MISGKLAIFLRTRLSPSAWVEARRLLPFICLLAFSWGGLCLHLPQDARAQTNPTDGLAEIENRAKNLGLVLEVPLIVPLETTEAPFRDEGADTQLVYLNCSLRPARVVSLASPMPGVVKEVLVRAGQAVSAGDPLIQLQDELLLADARLARATAAASSALDRSDAELAAAEKKFQVVQKGFKRKVISKLNYHKAESELATAQLQVQVEEDLLTVAKLEAKLSELLVEKTTIVAPVNGIVGEDIIEIGEPTQTRPLLEILVTSPLRLAVIVPERQIERFRTAANFQARVGNNEDRVFPVQLDYISPSIDQASNTVLAYFDVWENNVIAGEKCLVSFEPI